MRLTFDIRSFWQVGTGAGSMGTFDSRAARDPLGLPLIPGRQVKGLCREAMREAEQLGKVPAGATVTLFGSRAAPDKPLLDDPAAATLRFADARLPKGQQDALKGQHVLIAGLYQTHRSVEMTAQGIPKLHSLRFDEVVIPLTLEAAVTPLPGADANAAGWLRIALNLLNAVGSGRTRGLGRVIVTLEE